tara:strand:- start:965 stop:1117 length:153 start_codon:yes stop_codon:yes gene_type:complete
MEFRKKGLLIGQLHSSNHSPLLSIFEVAPQTKGLETLSERVFFISKPLRG